MGVLSDMCLNRENTLRELCYHVSKFKNNEEDFRIKSFSDDANDIDKTIVEELSTYNIAIDGVSFIETRLLLDCTKNNKKVVKQLQTDSENNKKVKQLLIEKLFDLYRADPAMTPSQTLEQALRPVMTPLQTLKQTLSQAVDGCTNENFHKVSSCRFVFAQFMTKPDSNTITGVLFYTDTHYGENLIDFNEEQLHKINEDCTKHVPALIN